MNPEIILTAVSYFYTNKSEALDADSFDKDGTF